MTEDDYMIYIYIYVYMICEKNNLKYDKNIIYYKK